MLSQFFPSLKLDEMNPTHKDLKSSIQTEESNEWEEPFTSEGMQVKAGSTRTRGNS